ncbi:putative hemolysin [Acetobacter cibinongensis]|uniref:putative hemolysin n=1 Tax=Acetobacter cibinongensis TaxID=146475 RepID=UPI001F0AF464|nr:DUF333 domain-containing protein [Acetobacter cibinongensis]
MFCLSVSRKWQFGCAAAVMTGLLAVVSSCQAEGSGEKAPLAAKPSQVATQPSVQPKRVIGMANPASVHCVDAGGRLEIRTGKAGQYGICHLPDGRSCEEWSYFRTGECSAESLKAH